MEIPTGQNLLHTKEAEIIIYNALSYYKENNPQLVLQDKLVIDNLKNYMKFMIKENKKLIARRRR